jgi:hypothetical protein
VVGDARSSAATLSKAFERKARSASARRPLAAKRRRGQRMARRQFRLARRARGRRRVPARLPPKNDLRRTPSSLFSPLPRNKTGTGTEMASITGSAQLDDGYHTPCRRRGCAGRRPPSPEPGANRGLPESPSAKAGGDQPPSPHKEAGHAGGGGPSYSTAPTNCAMDTQGEGTRGDRRARKFRAGPLRGVGR